MAKIEDLESEAKEAEEEFEGDDDGSEILMSQDVLSGLEILERARNLLRFLADKDLSGNITKKERGTMGWLADHIDEYVGEVRPRYEENDDDSE